MLENIKKEIITLRDLKNADFGVKKIHGGFSNPLFLIFNNIFIAKKIIYKKLIFK